MPLSKALLIANRGEIACRILRTAQRLNMRTIALYTSPERSALHVLQADEAYEIGAGPKHSSYLNQDKILEIACRSKARYIHPGYGFLSENAEFAHKCQKAGFLFIGPPPEAIRLMGLKHEAKLLAARLQIPIIPGYHGRHQEKTFLKAQAQQLGYPLLLKASAGGGGKGIRLVEKAEQFDTALAQAQGEAWAAFGHSHMVLEKYLVAPRHIEIQIFADQQGHIVHLFERECSLQRRHQKIFEEAPAPSLSQETRQKMISAALALAKGVHYVGAGTVEFLVEKSAPGAAERFYFMEMNTRLQVEHPVTECITGLDLVEWQIRVAGGENLPLTRQEDIRFMGHSCEARLYAEDPENDFLPSTGKLCHFHLPAPSLSFSPSPSLLPSYVRLDTGYRAGDDITAYYDPLLAKIITSAPTRAQALADLRRALEATHLLGVSSNVDFLRRLLGMEAIESGTYDTHFIAQHLEALGALKKIHP